jgi:hypothetical protein
MAMTSSRSLNSVTSQSPASKVGLCAIYPIASPLHFGDPFRRLAVIPRARVSYTLRPHDARGHWHYLRPEEGGEEAD